MHRDPRCFSPFPNLFLPERWLHETQRLALEPKIFNTQNGYIHNTTAFVPFSLGQANCAGKNLAWMEMRMLVCLMWGRTRLTIPSNGMMICATTLSWRKVHCLPFSHHANRLNVKHIFSCSYLGEKKWNRLGKLIFSRKKCDNAKKIGQ